MYDVASCDLQRDREKTFRDPCISLENEARVLPMAAMDFGIEFTKLGFDPVR